MGIGEEENQNVEANAAESTNTNTTENTTTAENTNANTNNTIEVEATKVNSNTKPNGKSKLVAGLLGIFLGSFGVHNFYLGYTNKAIAQLVLSLAGSLLCGIGPVAAWIWGLVEGIQILTGNINTDADGNPLVD